MTINQLNTIARNQARKLKRWRIAKRIIFRKRQAKRNRLKNLRKSNRAKMILSKFKRRKILLA